MNAPPSANTEAPSLFDTKLSMLRTSLAPLLRRALVAGGGGHACGLTATITSSAALRRRYAASAAAAAAAEIDASSSEERAIAELVAQNIAGAERVAVRDTSGGCGAMYTIEVRASSFAGVSTVKQHQLVAKALGEEVKKWHGFSLTTCAPSSAASKP